MRNVIHGKTDNAKHGLTMFMWTVIQPKTEQCEEWE